MRQSRVLHLLSFVTLAVFVDPHSVRAAERPVTLGATVGASTQGAGKSDLPYLGPPFGGTTVGSIVFIDAERGTIWSVGVEMSLATAITGTQRSRGNPRLGGSFVTNTFASNHKDLLFSGTVKAKTPANARFQAAAAAGFGLAIRQTDRVGTSTSDFPPVRTAPFQETVSDWVPAATFGADGAIALNRRISVLVIARLHALIDDDKLPSGVVARGVGSVLFRYGVGALVRF